MVLKNVILVGANGHLGPHILQALLNAKSFTVTVITRSSSKSQYPSEVSQARISDSLPHDELVQALRGQDALIIAFAGGETANSLKIINAALEAGVKRIIPADFGSCDSSDPVSLELIPLYGEKKKVREHLQQISKPDGMFWTSLINGHFFDYGLSSGLLAIDLKKRKAVIFDGGDIKWSATKLPTIGLAVVRILQNEEKFRNRLVYIQSISMTQNELLKSVEKVTGEKFEVENVSSEDYIRERKALVESKGLDHDTHEELVGVGGIVKADWEKKDNFVNEDLGLPKEHLDELVKQALGQAS